MYEIVRRALAAPPELLDELQRRGLFLSQEAAQLARRGCKVETSQPLGSVQFCTLLAHGDTQLAAAAVSRGLLTGEELKLADRLIRFRRPTGKRDELGRIIERAMEKEERWQRLLT